MHYFLKYLNQLRKARDLKFSQWEYSTEYINFMASDKDKNWASYDRFTMGFAQLNLPYFQKKSIGQQDILDDKPLDEIRNLIRSFMVWQYLCSQTIRYFPSRFLRQAEMLHGLMSIHSERLRLSVLLLRLFEELVPIATYKELNPMPAEAWFFLPEHKTLSPDLCILLLIQQIDMEISVADCLLQCLKKSALELTQTLDGYKIHLGFQKNFLEEQLKKTYELSDHKNLPMGIKLPKYHYLEYLKEFESLLVSLRTLNHFEGEIHRAEPGSINLQKMSISVSVKMQECREDIEKIAIPEMDENDALLGRIKQEIKKRVYEELTQPLHLKRQYETDMYDYYSQEMEKIQWHSSDVLKLLQEQPLKTITDNDYQLLDVVKEIAFCEGFSYTIGYQNMIHLTQLHDFQLWNVNQCHEELKHYHAIRILLNQSNILTEHMDEDYLASTFEEPSIDAYCERYTVFMINFLGETHNMRAYWLLAQAFDSPQIKKILEWIFYDEVVHKKVFALHFKKLTRIEPDWERNTYENLLDHGLGIHQAMRCCRYKVLMQKIGRYYASSGKTTALDFLNRSMRAQYLELKDLFQPGMFKLSEHDFRKQHLKAYLL